MIDDIHYAFCYLPLILDAYTKEIVGWCVGLTLDTVYPLIALDMALERIKDISKEKLDLTHHSDRRCQYASSKYIGKLQSIKISTKFLVKRAKINKNMTKTRLFLCFLVQLRGRFGNSRYYFVSFQPCKGVHEFAIPLADQLK